MTASAAALLAGLTSANAFPSSQPSEVARSGRHAVVLASRDKSSTKAKPAAEDVAAKAKGILSVVITIDKQQVTLYSDGHPIARSRVSTGVPGHPTPTGVFSIIQKDVAMHEGVVPNSPASHGCIRLPGAFARQMWGITKLGVRVIIARSEVMPVAIASDRLFTIKPAPAEPNGAPPAASPETVGTTTATSQFAQLNVPKRSWTVMDGKPPSLDAMAYAAPAPRDTTNTGPDLSMAEPRPLKPGPVSVFISRKEGKLFVRKGFEHRRRRQ